MSLIVRARLTGSSMSSGFGRPWPTSQNGQRRVQMSPMIMKVAVPLPKHSDRFGQLASSQTVCRLLARNAALTLATSADSPSRARIQLGFLSGGAVFSILIGMRAIFSAARSLTPATIGAGGVAVGVLIAVPAAERRSVYASRSRDSAAIAAVQAASDCRGAGTLRSPTSCAGATTVQIAVWAACASAVRSTPCEGIGVQ